MHLAGQHTIRAAPPAVWAALHDADILAICVPGCRTVQRKSPERFDVTAEASLGPLRILLAGSVEIEGGEEPSLLCLKGRGAGAAILWLSGTARITLSECAAGCRVGYEIEAKPMGLIAALGSPFLAALALRQVEQFIRSFKATVGMPPAARPQAPLEADGPQALS